MPRYWVLVGVDRAFLLASVALSFVGAVAFGAPATRAASDIAGKSFLIHAWADLDGDDSPSAQETNFLVALLRQAGANVTVYQPEQDVPVGPKDVLILGSVPLPTGKRSDAERAQSRRNLAALTEREKGETAKAKAVGATVVETKAVFDYFGTNIHATASDVRKFRFEACAAKLAGKLPEVKFDQIGLVDALDFCGDVSRLNLFVDWSILEAAGIDRNVPVTCAANGLKISDVIKLLCDKAAPGMLDVLLDREGRIVIVTKERAAKLVAAKPVSLIALAQMNAPPAEFFLAPLSALRPVESCRISHMDFIGKSWADSIGFVRTKSELQIEPDWDALHAAGLEKDEDVNARAHNVTAESAIHILIGRHDDVVAYVTPKGVVRITSRKAMEKAKDVAALIPQ